jgi:hypothetical protein
MRVRAAALAVFFAAVVSGVAGAAGAQEPPAAAKRFEFKPVAIGTVEYDAIYAQGGRFPGGTRLMAARFDLNADGQEELIVRIEHPDLCGRAGCSSMILTRRGQRWVAVFDDFVHSLAPGERTTNGWRDVTMNGRTTLRFARGAYRK